MTSVNRREWKKRFNLTEEKIENMVSRAIQACLAYEKGELSLRQVWYRARGCRFLMACQLHPDQAVAVPLWEE